MSKIVDIGNGFFNIRGSFTLLFGLLDLGTHSSLVKCSSNNYVLIDCVHLNPETKAQIDELTSSGSNLYAIINVHPFHTIYIEEVARQYPNAKLYGTQRHKDKFPALKWENELTESVEFRQLPWVKQDFEVDVPKGLRLVVPGDDNQHAGSVFIYHKASKCLHVDDTLGYVKHSPLPLRLAGIGHDTIFFHPGIGSALEPRANAGKDFLEWMSGLCDRWNVENVCVAHSGWLTKDKNEGKASVKERILAKVEAWRSACEKHDTKFTSVPAEGAPKL